MINLSEEQRALFPEVHLFKKSVRERFLVALREIYKRHPAYKFEDDMAATGIHIQPSYANISHEYRVPRFLIKIGQYNFGLQDGFFKNMTEEVRNNEGVVAGYKSFKVIPTTISVSVRAFVEEESSDLADELNMLGVFALHGMFTQVGINIQDATIGETQEVERENDLFETQVIFRVEVPWEYQHGTGRGPDDPNIDIDIPDPFGKEYRAPGVYTVVHNRSTPKN